MQNTKIKTTGLKLILRELRYKTNVVVHPTDNGYRTTLIAINENCLFEIHLVLKDYLFNDQSKVMEYYFMGIHFLLKELDSL